MSAIDAKVLKVLTAIVISGFKADPKEDENTIKSKMFAAHSDFNSINTLYKSITIESGLVIDPAVVTSEIKAQVEGSDWDGCKTWDDVVKFAEGIVEEVSGSTTNRVLSAAKKYCKENEIELPKEEKVTTSKARGGKINDAFVTAFNTNAKATKAECYALVRPVVKQHSNATDRINLHYFGYFAVANKITLAEAIEATKSESMPVDPTVPVSDEVAGDSEE